MAKGASAARTGSAAAPTRTAASRRVQTEGRSATRSSRGTVFRAPPSPMSSPAQRARRGQVALPQGQGEDGGQEGHGLELAV